LYHLHTLGVLRLTGPSGELLAGRRRELSLLAYLRRTPGGCSRTELASLLWGDRSEDRARHSLRQALLELRRATDGLLQVAEEEVRLDPEAVRLDVEGFEAALREGAVADALALWGGDFLAPVEGIGSERFRAGREGERARLRRLLRSALAEVAELVPGIVERFRGLPAPSRSARAIEDGVLEVLRSVAEETHVALLVDDLAAADEESFHLLHALARRLREAGVLLVFTQRTGDRPPEVRAAPLRDLPITRRVDLAPLRVDEVASMLGSMLQLPADQQRRLALSLHAETAGNPLYVYELTAALVEESHLVPDDAGRWEAALPLNAPLPLPTGIREIVARRLARLSGPARELLGAAAVLGERFDLRRLDDLGALPPEELSAALDELLARRLIRELPNRPGSYVFSHSLTRRVAYDRLLPGRRDALLNVPTGSRRPWYRQLWRAPEAVFVDAGAEGEWLAARLRLTVMGLLLILPVTNLLEEPSYLPYQTGFAISLVAVAVAVAIFVTLRRDGYRPGMGFFSATADVSLVSLALLSFALVGAPHAAVNSKPVFDTYFLAIVGSSLRYDRRICIVAGGAAILEYLLLLIGVTSHWDLNGDAFAPFPYGMFSWASQIGRLVLFLAMTLLSWELVRRAQELRDQATRDPATGLWSRTLFQNRAGAELARARRFGYDVSLALLRVDGLERLTERRGPSSRDVLLRSLAGVLASALRGEDVLARHSSDEVAVLLPGVDLPTASRKMDAVREDLLDLLRGASVGLTAGLELRVGVATFPADGDGLESLRAQAEGRAGRDGRPLRPAPS
jgi:diguanylate cyclase (GGDEF)-like protein